jgi:hypothetical protein
MSKVEDIQENVFICMKFCGSCPSYPGVEGEALYCSWGESSAPRAKQGCKCVDCAVHKKYECNGSYYCIEGLCD